MSKAIRRTLVGAAALLALVLALGVWASAERHTASAGGDPMVAVQALIDAANASLTGDDPTPFAATFTEDAFFEIIENGSFAFVGRDAIAAGLSSEPGEADTNFHVTLLSSQVNGNTVTGVINVTDRDSVGAGVSRYLQPFTAVVEGSLVASLKLRLDTSDAQTATYLAYVQAQPDNGGDLPADTVQIDLAGDQPGSASVGHFDSTTFVIVNIDPGAAGAIQPAHIHTGTCASPGPIVYPLASIVDGHSFTQFSVPPAELLTHNYIVNVDLSEAQIGTYVSCAKLAAPPATPTARPAATATPVVVLPNTGSGGTGGDSPWLVIALLTSGAAMLAGLGALRLRARR